MEDFLLKHIAAYPGLQPQDMVRLLYEMAFGEGLSAPALEIEAQGNALSPDQLARPYTDPLPGPFVRMNLSVLQLLPTDIFARMIELSAIEGDESLYDQGLRSLIILGEAGQLPFPPQCFHAYLKEPPQCPPHSQTYLATHSPAYRVVRSEMGEYLTLIVKISRLLYQLGEVTVAIDGQSAAGKTTLAGFLQEIFDCVVFHTAAFIKGGTFDYRRFQHKICDQLNTGKAFSLGGETYSPKRLHIIEGLYSLHPALLKYYELKVFLGISPSLQAERMLKRCGETQFGRFAGEQLPRETAYLERQRVELTADLCFYH